MGLLLENAFSEELPSLHSNPRTPRSSGATSSSSSSPLLSTAAPSDSDKMLAACIGAVLTSLTMTPFDVVKTRLQTQAPQSAHSLAGTSPWPPPVPSTSTTPPPPTPSPRRPPPPPPVSRPAHSHAQARATCNPRSYFNHNPALHHLAPAGSGSGGVACLYPPSHPVLSLAHHPTPLPAPTRHLTGFADALVTILRTEGPAALWRGTAPALAMSVPGQVVYMVGYDALRRTALSHSHARENPGMAGALVPLAAGSASRAAVAVLLSPVELVRTRLQAQTRANRVPLGALVRELRWGTAWRGLSSTLWRDVPFSGVYWAGYEGIKRALTGGRGMGESLPGAAKGTGSGGGEFAVAFVSGAGSGMIAATLTNPFDVIKTRRQAPSPSAGASVGGVVEEARTLALLRHVLRTEGYRALWAGLTPRLAKVGPACGLMIGCYEAISGWSAAGRGVAAGAGRGE